MGCGSSNTADTRSERATTSKQQTTEVNEQKDTSINNQSSSDPKASRDPKASFIADTLKVHNDYRDKHGTPHVTHAQDLSDYAQKWAEHLAKTGKFDHSDCQHNGGRIGENLAMIGGSDLSSKKAIDYIKMWYDEIKDYHYFGKEPDMKKFGEYGHFTQVVWKGTKEVGIGIASAKNQCIVVGSYRPAGNMMGDFSNNVPPPF